MDRGFVVYTGTEVRLLDPEIWALPITALGTASAFGPGRPTTWIQDMELPMAPDPALALTPDSDGTDATVFLSYVHWDNEQVSGNIVHFAEEVIDHYDFLTGNRLQLIWDRQNVAWGENWASRLTAFAETTTFLMAAVTPHFLKSKACKQEVLDFLAAAGRSGDTKLLLPVIWVDVANTDVVAASDPVLRAIEDTQQLRITDLWQLARGTPAWRDAVHQAAQALRTTIAHRAAAADQPPATTTGAQVVEDDRDGLFEALANPDFTAAAGEATAAISQIAGVLATAPVTPRQPHANLATLAEIGRRLRPPINDLEQATERLGQAWTVIDNALAPVVAALNDGGGETIRQDLIAGLTTLKDSTELPGVEQISAQLQLWGSFSKHLRPMSKSLSATIRLLASIQAAVSGWLAQVA
jgi:hypothetical protein